MTTAVLCAAFEVGESTVHAKARAIEKALGTHPFDPQLTLPSLTGKKRRIDSLHPGGSQRAIVSAKVAEEAHDDDRGSIS
jgi:hypothetical protein